MNLRTNWSILLLILVAILFSGCVKSGNYSYQDYKNAKRERAINRMMDEQDNKDLGISQYYQ